MSLFKLLFLFIFFTFNLFAWGMGGGNNNHGNGGGNNNHGNGINIMKEFMADMGAFLTGDWKPFDSWDSFRDADTPPDDRNTSTKIISKDFNLSLASLNKDGDDYELRDADDSDANNDINVSIYIVDDEDIDNKTIVSNTIQFDPTDIDHISESDNFKITEIHKEVVLGYLICASYDGDYTIYPLDECDEDDEKVVHKCNDGSDEEELKLCFASDSFAVRPKQFTITDITTPLISAKEQNFSVKAINEDGTTTSNYTVNNDDYDFNATQIRYETNDTIDNDNSLYGDMNITQFDFTDGEGTVTITYSDIGKVQLTPIDSNFASIDEDDTPYDCNNTEGNMTSRSICGDTNATFIPSHFVFYDVNLTNHNNSKFTYISNDTDMLLMSAHIGAYIGVQNEKNETTKNFDSDSWVHPITIDFTTKYQTDITKNLIKDINLSFKDGKYTIPWSEENSSLNLMFNYERNISDAINPFFVDGVDSNISIYSLYTNDNNITDNNGTEIGIDGNATFLYARTNAPLSRFVKADTYNVKIYYELFCYATDRYDNDCNKSLLPDGEDSNITDDPRWFVNTQHNNTDNSFGLAQNITQKSGTGVDVDTQPTGDHQDIVTLKYSGNFPYKTTMQNEASSWLIYNKYDANATINEFEVEFNKESGKDWAGVTDGNVSNTNVVKTTIRTNRRTMW